MITKTSFRVVLDTNIFVASYLSKNEKSPNREIIKRWLEDEFTLLYSEGTIVEFIEKLREKGIEQNLIVELIANISMLAENIFVPKVEDILKDKDDNIILSCAIYGKATHLVTYDFHFYDFKNNIKFDILESIPFLFKLRKELEKRKP